jgi:ATP/maltotriose-dependent transcriptional regulator MalT
MSHGAGLPARAWEDVLVAAATSLVGRAAELDAVDSALAWLGARTGGFLLVGGEPGIGKSRLLEELAERAARRNYFVLSGRAAEFEREMPFAAWVDAMDSHVGSLDATRLSRMGVERTEELAGIFPSLGDLDGAGLPDDRFRAHRAVRELLDGLASTRPLVVVLDDLHWADQASLELLAALARRPPERAVLVAGGHRPADTLDPLRAALDRADHALALELGPLPETDARRLIPSATPAPRRAGLLAEAGGNPFYLQQLARVPGSAARNGPAELIEGGFTVPAGVAASIAEELAALPTETRTLLWGAAVAGEPFDLWLAAAAANLPIEVALEAVDGASAVELVRPIAAPGQFLFRHPLVRRAIYAGAGDGFRLAAHRRAAAALAERRANASTRAHHVARSAQPGDEAAVALLVNAAGQRAARAPAAAASWYADALRLLQDGPPDRRADLLMRRARALLAAGHLEQSHEAMEAALELVPLGEDLEPVALLAEIERWLGRPEAATGRLVRAMAGLAERDPRSAALLGVQLMLMDYWNGLLESALQRGQEALEAAQQAGDDAVIAAVEATLGQFLVHVDVTGGRALLDAAAGRIARLPDERLEGALEVLYSLGWGTVHLDRYDEALAHFRRGLAIAGRIGAVRHVATFRIEPIEPLMRAGRIADALATAEEAVEAARLHPSPRFAWWALWLRGAALLRAGDLERARADLDEAAGYASRLSAPQMLDVWMGYLEAHILSMGGGHEAAVARLLDAGGGEDLPRIPPSDRQGAWEILVGAALDRGDEAAADAWSAEAERWAQQSGLDGIAGFAARCRARTELARGDTDLAVAAAADSVAAFHRLGTALDGARSQVLQGECLMAAGRKDEAVRVLVEAEETLHELGTERFRAEAARVLRRLGRRTPPRTAAIARTMAPAATAPTAAPALDALSPREHEIAALVHRQLSNREIAQELFLSEKTVQTHLRNIFHKLGVSSRVAVAVAVEQAAEEIRH